MRLGQAILLGSAAALLTLAAPTLARNSNPPKASEAPAFTSCHAYQQAADSIAVSGTAIPCHRNSQDHSI